MSASSSSPSTIVSSATAPPPSSSSTHREYQSALAVNNWGVTLLSHHNYDAAIEMFHDSLLLINLACHRACPFPVPYTSTPHTLQHIVHRASQRLATRCYSSSQLDCSVPGSTRKRMVIRPVSDDVDSTSTIENMEVALRSFMVQHHASSSSKCDDMASSSASQLNNNHNNGVFPIRFEAHLYEDYGVDAVPSDESAMLVCDIVLHNLSLALLCQAYCNDSVSTVDDDVMVTETATTTAEHNNNTDVYYRKSFRILDLCQKITHTLGQSLPHRIVTSPTTIRQLLCIQAMIVISYYQILQQHERYDEAQAALQSLLHIQSQLCELAKWNVSNWNTSNNNSASATNSRNWAAAA